MHIRNCQSQLPIWESQKSPLAANPIRCCDCRLPRQRFLGERSHTRQAQAAAQIRFSQASPTKKRKSCAAFRAAQSWLHSLKHWKKQEAPKLPNAVAEAKAALDAIDRGLTNIRINVYVWTYKDGKPNKKTEVDVLSDEEWTEVKDGDYSTEKKIKGGDDLKQFNMVRNFFKGNVGAELYDSDGKKITKPTKWRYVFTNAKGITQKLKDWLTGRDVDEVEADKIIKPAPLPTEKKKNASNK